MLNVLIIGYGVVGNNLENEIKSLSPDIIDKYKPEDNKISKSSSEEGYDLAFVCVNTPFIDDGDPCDYSEVINAINENKDKMKEDGVFVIKSTILPGTTELVKEETKQNVIFSPEYYGSTQHNNNFEFDFTILAGDREDCIKVVQVLQNVYDARHRFHITDSKTAELSKYMENSWLATKVSFCSQFFEIAEMKLSDRPKGSMIAILKNPVYFLSAFVKANILFCFQAIHFNITSYVFDDLRIPEEEKR